MRLITCTRLAALALVLPTAGARAQARPATVDEAVRVAVVDSLARAIEQRFAVADTGRLIAERLRSRQRSGAYRALTQWPHFVRAVTMDMQSINHDTHLWLELAGEAGAPTAAAGLHGVERVERLSGNVGYLAMSGFLGGTLATRAVGAALDQLRTAEAIVIDVRNSRGGSGELSNFLLSHFLPDSVLTLRRYDRLQDLTTDVYTLATVPGPRRTDVPLFILTDDVTRSAAEVVPFVLQNARRATVVGERTAGAGRNNPAVAMPYGLVASISVTIVSDPRTGRQWEGSGVTPDVQVDRDSALHVAHRLALDTLIAHAHGQRKRRLELVREAIAASQAAREIARGTLGPYVGTYEGGQSLAYEGGTLVYQSRIAQPRLALVPLGGLRFAAGAERYELSTAGGTPVLRITQYDGSTAVFRRVSPRLPRRATSPAPAAVFRPTPTRGTPWLPFPGRRWH